MQRWRYKVSALAVVAVNAGLPPVQEVGAILLSGRLLPTETAEQLAVFAWVAVARAAVSSLSFSSATATPAGGVSLSTQPHDPSHPSGFARYAVGMKFCDDCGSMMKANDDAWVCGSCGAEETRNTAEETDMSVSESQEETDVVDVSDVDDAQVAPTTEARCPECGHDRASYEMKQIRAADESETRFFTCTECDHKWREDDH